MPSGWDLSLSPHALLISLTPAGEALARRGAGGEPGDLGSLCLSTCPASAPSGSWGRRPGLPSAAFGPRVWCPPPPGKMPAGGDGGWGGHVRPAPSGGQSGLRTGWGVQERDQNTAVPPTQGAERGRVSSITPASCGHRAPEMWPQATEGPNFTS